MSYSSQSQMTNAITKYMKNKIESAKKKNAAVHGTLSLDGKVTIGNKQYPAVSTIALPVFKSTLSVWCVIDDNDSGAVIVGR